MLLKGGIRDQSTINMQEMQLFLNERPFWRNVLERLIDIVIFLSERNFALEVRKKYWDHHKMKIFGTILIVGKEGFCFK